MKILIVEDDFANRWVLQKHLTNHGSVDVAQDGEEALQLFNKAWEKNEPYDLICLDIMLPKKDGQQVLEEIRLKEQELGLKQENEAKIIMITILEDPENVFKAYYKGRATSYILKPVDSEKLDNELRKLKLID